MSTIYQRSGWPCKQVCNLFPRRKTTNDIYRCKHVISFGKKKKHFWSLSVATSTRTTFSLFRIYSGS